MRGLKEAVVRRRLLLELCVPALWQWLRQDAKDGLVVLGSYMMPGVYQDWLTLVAAQVFGPMATYIKAESKQLWKCKMSIMVRSQTTHTESSHKSRTRFDRV